VRRILAIVPAAVLAAGLSAPAGAATLRLAPGEAVQAALDRAQDGDVIELAAGDHQGGIRIDRSVTLTGLPGAKLVGDGTGSVVTVNAPGVAVRGLTVTKSGRDMQAMDSGIFLARTAERARVEDNGSRSGTSEWA